MASAGPAPDWGDKLGKEIADNVEHRQYELKKAFDDKLPNSKRITPRGAKVPKEMPSNPADWLTKQLEWHDLPVYKLGMTLRLTPDKYEHLTEREICEFIAGTRIWTNAEALVLSELFKRQIKVEKFLAIRDEWADYKALVTNSAVLDPKDEIIKSLETKLGKYAEGEVDTLLSEAITHIHDWDRDKLLEQLLLIKNCTLRDQLHKEITAPMPQGSWREDLIWLYKHIDKGMALSLVVAAVYILYLTILLK